MQRIQVHKYKDSISKKQTQQLINKLKVLLTIK